MQLRGGISLASFAKCTVEGLTIGRHDQYCAVLLVESLSGRSVAALCIQLMRQGIQESSPDLVEA